GEVVDHRSDLYSAGCVLFELLTNRPPFQGDSPVAVAYQHVREQAPRVSDFNPMVSPAMESVVGRALTKEPGRRFQTASEFSAALQDALRGIPVHDEEETAAIGMVPAMAGVGAGAAGADPAPSMGAPLSARTPEDPALYAEAEDYPPRRRGRVGRVLLWLLLVLILAAGAAWALAEMLSPQRVEIPDIEGMSRTDAVSELNEQNLDPEIETEPHDDIDEDLAIRTDPGAGEQVDAESPITLYISAGQDSVVIPDGLQGQSEDEVRETFDELGLEIGEITDDTHPSVEEDRLISTDPEAGETVSQGSSVDLVMSNGQVVMPGVFNTNQYDAQAVLEDLELNVEFVESENGEYTPGTVIGQQVDGSSVQAGDLIPQQSTVTLSIATAPPPPPEDDGDDEDDDDPTDEPTSDEPSESPTDDESEDPSESPTDDESDDPSESPTDEESETDEPSPSPSPSPTEDDDESDEPSPSPTGNGSPTNDD
ncbi:MAG TPA: PASTA domain-containing protein, partial [Candidatus Nesterenkonia stercoripullorum]|nr:PASTA domain-containing protein [Candidatus Nesterenkonia stercoripullorum]